MVMALVWSERPEPNATGLRDCTYSAGLTALVGAGHSKFPLGIYSVAEREALERSDAQPNETGASLDDLIVAVRRRYGIALTKSSVSLLAQHHARKDLLFVIQGSYGHLPKGHTLRRFDPTFTGGHCVTIQPTGDGTHVRFLDPEAPMKFTGDTVDWATVMKFIGTMPSMITFRVDAYAPPPVVVVPPKPAVVTYTQAQYDEVVKQRDGYALTLSETMAALIGIQTEADALQAKITALVKPA